MIEQDTIKLLRECDAGVDMGVSSLNEVLPYVRNEELKNTLTKGIADHEKIKKQLDGLLDTYHDDGKKPNPIAQGMSHLKTGAMLLMNESDSTIADLMTDGCNMGVKSLSRYLNQYEAADETSKNITKSLIHLEENLAISIRPYL